jgi:ribonuclease-3
VAVTGSGDEIAERLGYVFRDVTLLETALSHSSYSNEIDGSRGNERLEFLGDAVLALVVAHRLYDSNPSWMEGQLSRAMAGLVNEAALAELARELDLGRFLKLGRSERKSEGHEKPSILADCFEAVLGAVYLDGGLEAATAFLNRIYGAELGPRAAPPRKNPKMEVNELSIERFGEPPHYRTVLDTGVEHDELRFTIEVRIGGESWGQGVGRSKRVAEHAAAEAALAREAASDD